MCMVAQVLGVAKATTRALARARKGRTVYPHRDKPRGWTRDPWIRSWRETVKKAGDRRNWIFAKEKLASLMLTNRRCVLIALARRGQPPSAQLLVTSAQSSDLLQTYHTPINGCYGSNLDEL